MMPAAQLLLNRGATVIGRRALVVLGAIIAVLAIPAMAFADETHPCPDDPFDCVPAWRWASNSDRFYTDFASNPISGAMSAAGTFIPSLFFTIAKVLWTILFWAVRWALTHDYLSETSHTIIDQNFARVAEWATQGWAPLLFIIAFCWIAISVARKSVGGKGQLSWADALRPATCFALLFYMMWAAAAAPSTTPTAGNVRVENQAASARTGAPSWWISKSQEITGVLGSFSARTMSGFTNPPDDRSAIDGVRSRLGCYRVSDWLMRESTRGLAGEEREINQMALLISTIWQRTYQEQYAIAQFGDTDSARRMNCYMLEHQNMRPSSEMRWIANRNGVSATEPAFSSWGTDENKERELTALAACHWRSTSNVTEFPEWRAGYDAQAARNAAEGSTGDQIAGAVDSIMNWVSNFGSPDVEDYCEEVVGGSSSWWSQWSGINLDFNPSLGNVMSLGVFNRMPDDLVTVEFYDDRIRSNGDPFLLRRESNIISGTTPPTTNDADLRAAAEVREFLMALNGHNIKNSGGNGLISVVVALVYGFAIGGLAVGALMAQFGALAFAVAFPFVLMMGMWPTEAAKNRFYKLCRIGVGMLFARLVMVTLLTLLVIFTVVFIEVMEAVNVGFTALSAVHGGSGMIAQAGFASGMMQAVPPLAGVLTLKWLSKQAGIGNPTSLKGATGMVSNIASNAQNMGTHQGGRGMSMLKQRMHPMSPYGPMSMRRNMKRLQGGLSAKGKGKGKPGGPNDPKADKKKQQAERDRKTGMPDAAASEKDRAAGDARKQAKREGLGKDKATIDAKAKEKSKAKSVGDQSARSERKLVGADGRAHKASHAQAELASADTADTAELPDGRSGPEPPAWFKRAAEAKRNAKDTLTAEGRKQVEGVRNHPTARKAAELARNNWYANQGLRAAGAAGRGAVGAGKWAWGAGKERHELNFLQRNTRRAAIGAGGLALFGGAAAALPLGGVMPAVAAAGSHVPVVGGAFSAMGANMVAPAVMGGGFGGFQAVALAYGGVQASKLARGGRGAVAGAVEHYGQTQQVAYPFDAQQERPFVAYAGGHGQIPPPDGPPTPPSLPLSPSGGGPAPAAPAAGFVPARGGAAPAPAPVVTHAPAPAPAPVPMPAGQPSAVSGYQYSQSPSGLHVASTAPVQAVAAPVQAVAATPTFAPPTPTYAAAAPQQVVQQVVAPPNAGGNLGASIAPAIATAMAGALSTLPAQMAAMGSMAAASRIGGGAPSQPTDTMLVSSIQRLSHELRTATDTQQQLRGSMDQHRSSVDRSVSTTQASTDRMRGDLDRLGGRLDQTGARLDQHGQQTARSVEQLGASTQRAAADIGQATHASSAATQQAAQQIGHASRTASESSRQQAVTATQASQQMSAATQQAAQQIGQSGAQANTATASARAAAAQASTTARQVADVARTVDRSSRGLPQRPTK